jgi:cell division protein FtsL
MQNTRLDKIMLIISIFLFACVLTAGGVSMKNSVQQKRTVSKQISASEADITKLRRLNDELSLKIAEQVNPVRLMKRASTNLIQPNITESIVWAYENYNGGRVEYKHKKSETTISFKMPTKK